MAPATPRWSFVLKKCRRRCFSTIWGGRSEPPSLDCDTPRDLGVGPFSTKPSGSSRLAAGSESPAVNDLPIRLFVPTVVLMSWVDWTPSIIRVPGLGGPYWAGIVLLAGLAAGARTRVIRQFARTISRDKGCRLPVFAALAVVLFWSISAIGAVDSASAIAESARVCLVLLFL